MWLLKELPKKSDLKNKIIMKQDKLWNANNLKVMATNFTMSFAFFLLTPLLPLYLSENFGASKDMIGLVLSGYTITALLIRPFSGFLVDSFPRKKVLLISLFLYFLLFGGYLLAGTLVLFAIVLSVHSTLLTWASSFPLSEVKSGLSQQASTEILLML